VLVPAGGAPAVPPAPAPAPQVIDDGGTLADYAGAARGAPWRSAALVLALLTMTVGNLVALGQRRMVRLLAWSSIAQAGYILAALAVPDGGATALTYAVFFVALELAAFAAVVALRTPAPVEADARVLVPAGAASCWPAPPWARPRRPRSLSSWPFPATRPASRSADPRARSLWTVGPPP